MLLSLTSTGQEPEKEPAPPYQMPAPKGWGKETIRLPPAFAADLGWKGVEELRFAPGMFKADSDSFLSYAVLFWLPAEQKADAKALEQGLLAYYRGLSRAVLQSKKQEVDVAAFTLSLKDVTPDKVPRRASGETYSTLTGQLKWVEPFVTGKPQTLRLEIQTWTCEKAKRRCVFVCASPQPDTAAVWKSLREIRTGTRCHAEAP
jgi:hypothetical protein